MEIAHASEGQGINCGIAGAAISSIVFYYFNNINRCEQNRSEYSNIHFGFFAYLGFFIFGLPSILVLQRKEKLTIVNLTACATVLGVMVYGVFLWLLSLVMGVNLSFDIVKALWVGAFFGGGIAIAYGLIAGADFK